MTTKQALRTARRAPAECAVSLARRRVWYAEVTTREQAAAGMEQLLSAVDKSTADYINRPADEAFAEAEKLATDKRYTAEHIRKTIGERFAEARATIQERYDAEIKSMDEARPKLEKLAIGPASPKPEEAAALLYARDSLQARTARMSDQDVAKLWEAALEGNDLTTARVLADFLPAWRWQHKGQPAHTLPGWFEKAREETELRLMTPEARKARETLANDKQRRTALSIIKNRALAKVHAAFQIERDGTLTDGARAEQRRRHRAMW